MKLNKISLKIFNLPFFAIIIIVAIQIPVQAENKKISPEHLEMLIFSPIQIGETSIDVVMDKKLYSRDELPLISITGHNKSNFPALLDVHVALVQPDGTILEYPDWNQMLLPWLPNFSIPSNFQLSPTIISTAGSINGEGHWHVLAGLADPKTKKFVSLKAFPFELTSFPFLGDEPSSFSGSLKQSDFNNQIFTFSEIDQKDIFDPSAQSLYYFYEDGRAGHLSAENYSSIPQINWLNWKVEGDILFINDNANFSDSNLNASRQIKFISSPSNHSIAYNKVANDVFSPIKVSEIDGFVNTPLLIALQESSFIGKTIKTVVNNGENGNTTAIGLSLRFDREGQGVSYLDWTGWRGLWSIGWGEFDAIPMTWEISAQNMLIIKFEDNSEISFAFDKQIEVGDSVNLSVPFLFENGRDNAFILKVEKSIQETDFIDKEFELTAESGFTDEIQIITFNRDGLGILGKLKSWLPFRDSNGLENTIPMTWKITSSNNVAITYHDNEGLKKEIELRFTKHSQTPGEGDLLIISSDEANDEGISTASVFANIFKVTRNK